MADKSDRKHRPEEAVRAAAGTNVTDLRRVQKIPAVKIRTGLYASAG